MPTLETKIDALIDILARLEERLVTHFPTPAETEAQNKQELEYIRQRLKARGITITPD